MKVLITSGAGFIGSELVQYILDKYPTFGVVNLDAFTYARGSQKLNEVKNNRRHSFVQGRIEGSKLMDKLILGLYAVIDFAAASHVDRSILKTKVFITTNMLGTQIPLDAALCHKVKLFHQISRDEIYNIGTHNDWDNIDLANKILKILRRPESLLTSVKYQPGQDKRYATDSSQLRPELHRKPSITSERGLVDTVQQYSEASK